MGTVGMRRSSRLFVGGTKRLESLGKGFFPRIMIRATRRFEQLRPREAGERQILSLPTMPHCDIPLTEANDVIIAEAHFKVSVPNPKCLFNAVQTHRSPPPACCSRK